MLLLAMVVVMLVAMFTVLMRFFCFPVFIRTNEMLVLFQLCVREKMTECFPSSLQFSAMAEIRRLNCETTNAVIGTTIIHSLSKFF